MTGSLSSLRFLWILSVSLLPSAPAAAEPVDYARDIKPLLSTRCYSCHGALQQKAKLRLDTAALMKKGGRSGPAVVPGKSADSPLIEAITGNGRRRMPPEGEGTPLDARQVALLRAWIDSGTAAPADEQPVPDPRNFWSYRPPTRPAVPAVKNAGWVRNPIDAFLAAEQEKRGLSPRPPASREVLLRRVFLDLIGLPPTRAELHAFLADRSADAYEKVVDRLLADPRYGERWGRHWMDVWRYSDWYGSRAINQIRYSQRHIWRRRDWIVESLNKDKGYDRMVTEMLAGDELAPADPDTVRATGFLARNWYKFDRNVWMFETVEQTSQAFLALTLKCCRCHDHKYDPIAQKDYYRFRAFFEPHACRTDPVPGQADLLKDGLSHVFDEKPDAPTYLFARGDDRYPIKDQPLTPGVPAALGSASVDVQPVRLPVESYSPELRPDVVESKLAAARSAVQEAEARVAKARADKPAGPKPAPAAVLVAERQSSLARAELVSLTTRVAAERGKASGTSEAKHLALTAGKAEREAAAIKAELAVLQAEQALAVVRGTTPKTKAVLDAEQKVAAARTALVAARDAAKTDSPAYTPFGAVYPKISTGRRLALARWITESTNPRTARVAVNHLWLRHFGKALVPTVANFGLNGKPPSHPELLDWLAVELTDNGWSMKHLHRLLVTSNAYRMTSTAGESHPGPKLDPNNVYLWRMNSRRLEAEAVRDSVLYAAGRLDPTRGGPELDEKLGEVSARRSLYFRTTPNENMPFLDLFDLANPNQCYERQVSVVPQQALALANSALALDQARLLAQQLSKEYARDADFVTAAFEQTLSRAPTAAELAACQRFLQQHAVLLRDGKGHTVFPAGGEGKVPPASDPAAHARENLVHVLFSHNDFVTIR